MSGSNMGGASGYARLLERILRGDAVALDALGSMLAYGSGPSSGLAVTAPAKA
jgi:hypothetical protein